MYNKTIILRSRPAGQPAGLPARAGRSLCRRRPVSMPVWAPGALSPTPFRLCRRTSFFSWISGRPKNINAFFRKIGVFFVVFDMLANVELNLRLKFVK